MAKLQVPPVYGSNESAPMTAWFKLLWKWVVDLRDDVDTLYIASGTTATTTSGTAHDFTGIPTGVKRIVISFRGVSLSGSANLLVQIGTSGGIETTGYVSSSTTSTGAAGGTVSSTAGFIFRQGGAGLILSGHMVLVLHDSTTFVWTESNSHKDATTEGGFGGGDKALSAELTQVRITTSNGTDTFDAGSVNIIYER